MTAYVRPVVPVRVFRDASGQVIEYGNRWGHQSPPETTYSVATNPERFAPLHTIAEGLIAHLAANYQAGSQRTSRTRQICSVNEPT